MTKCSYLARWFFVAVMLVGGLTACSSKPAPTPTPAPTAARPAPAVAPTAVPTTAPPKPAPTVAPTAAPKPAATAAPAAAAKTIDLKYVFNQPPSNPLVVVAKNWYVPEIAKRTGGRVKVTVFDSESLAKAKDTWNLLLGGAFEMAYIPISLTPGVFPLTEFGSLPFLYASNLKFLPAYFEMAKRGWFEKEAGAAKFLGPHSGTSSHLALNKKITKADELKGMKLRTYGGLVTPTLSAMGAVPVATTAPETYLALQKGMVDGAAAMPYTMLSYKWLEVTKYYAEMSLGGSSALYAMNKDVWQKLPDDIKAVFDGIALENSLKAAGALVEEDDKGYEAMRKRGVEIYAFPPAELQLIRKAIQPVFTDFVKDLDAKGKRGTEFMKDLKSVFEQQGLPWPY